MKCTDTKVHRYRVKTKFGKTKIVRLWLTNDGCVCIMDRGKQCHGHYLNSGFLPESANWVSLVPCSTEINYVRRLMQRARKAHSILSQSGLWEEIRDEIGIFLALPKEKIEEFVNDANENFYENVFEDRYKEGERKYPWLSSYKIFETFIKHKRCFVSPNIGGRHYIKQRISEAIGNKTDCHYRWTNGYDNTISVEVCKDGKFRGWYSEEYRECGNGHYYLLFDATHAIFYEDD